VHFNKLALSSKIRIDSTNFAIMLPGNATLTVQSRPLVGLKTAVGLEVSSATGTFEVLFGMSLGGFCRFCLASDKRLRFCMLELVAR